MTHCFLQPYGCWIKAGEPALSRSLKTLAARMSFKFSLKNMKSMNIVNVNYVTIS